MTLLGTVWKNLWRRKSRTVLTASGIGIGVAAGVAMTAIAWGFEKSFEDAYRARATDMVVTRITSKTPLPAQFDQDRAGDLAKLPGVEAVAGMLSNFTSIEGAPSIIVYGWEPGTFLWEHLSVRGGSIAAGEGPADTVYLGMMAAEMLKKKPGDILEIEDQKLTVGAVFESGAVVENGAAVLPLPTLQRILDSPGKVNFLNLRLAPETNAERFEALRETIQIRFRGLKAYRAGEVGANNIGVQSSKAMSLATCAVALLIGTLGIMNAAMMSVFERIKEIGLLSAVGWCRGRIISMILIESTAVSLVGAVAGCALGVATGLALQSMPFARGKIQCDFSASILCAALAVAALLGVLGGLYPALNAASIPPRESLHTT
jgi:putative ABC transport system permease protein